MLLSPNLVKGALGAVGEVHRRMYFPKYKIKNLAFYLSRKSIRVRMCSPFREGVRKTSVVGSRPIASCVSGKTLWGMFCLWSWPQQGVKSTVTPA